MSMKAGLLFGEDKRICFGKLYYFYTDVEIMSEKKLHSLFI